MVLVAGTDTHPHRLGCISAPATKKEIPLKNQGDTTKNKHGS
jgi:hypothetical protein